MALLSRSPKLSGVGPKTYINLMQQEPHRQTLKVHWAVREEGSQGLQAS